MRDIIVTSAFPFLDASFLRMSFFRGAWGDSCKKQEIFNSFVQNNTGKKQIVFFSQNKKVAFFSVLVDDVSSYIS